MHELQKVYVAYQGSRDAAGFNWNAQLTAQVKRDSHVVIIIIIIIIIMSLFHHKIKLHILCYNELKKLQKSTYILCVIHIIIHSREGLQPTDLRNLSCYIKLVLSPK